MLLKAIPEAEQQALVTDRALSTTAILYKLLVRFQPGGPGEKQQLLSQLTTVPTAKTVHELAAGIRNWCSADGILLLKALDAPIQHLASLDPQAAFRLAQSRMQLQLEEKPVHANRWAFSQCLLAEAETLCLLTTSPASTVQSPLKMKQLQGDPKTPPRSTTTDGPKQTSSLVDKPCKYFSSESGCKAGKACKWSHSWEGITDKASRGGKNHRKSECRLRSGGKQQSEPAGSGGGRGGAGGGNGASSTSASTPNAVGGKAGAAAEKGLGPGIKEMTAQSSGDGKGTTTAPEVTSSTQIITESKGGGSGGSEGGSKSDKTIELLHEATQLLKTLRVQPGNPKLNVMQISGLDRVEENMALIDSGATHGLRPARDEDEWLSAERAQVQLASGFTDAFRLKRGTKILLGPTESSTVIVPMGGLNGLDYKVEWSNGICQR